MSTLKFIRNDLKDDYGILELQDKLLEIMVYIDGFCKERDIDYCLMAGSALGARRHNGFIPWDDDIDIYMTESDYSKFKTEFLNNGDCEKYYLQEWGKVNHKGVDMISLAKLKMNGTRIREEAFDGWKIHQGVFVDIFILHNCPNDIEKQKKQYFWTEAVVLKGLQIRGYQAKNIKDKLMLTVAKLMPRKWIQRLGLKNAYMYQSKQTDYVHGFVDTRSFSRAVFPKDIIFPTKYVDFENVKLKVPANNDEYLRIQFGDDYLTPPPASQRPICKHASAWTFDEKIKYEDFSDEKKLL